MQLIIICGQSNIDWAPFASRILQANTERLISAESLFSFSSVFELFDKVKNKEFKQTNNELEKQSVVYVHQGDPLELLQAEYPKINCRVIQFFSSPEYCLALNDFKNPQSPEEPLKTWHQDAQALFTLSVNFGVNSQLYNLGDALENIEGFCSSLNEAQARPINMPAGVLTHSDSLLSALSQLEAMQDLCAQTLIERSYEQLQSAAELLDETGVLSLKERQFILIKKSMAKVLKLREQHNSVSEHAIKSEACCAEYKQQNLLQKTQNNKLVEECSKLKSEAELSHLQIHQLQEALEKTETKVLVLTSEKENLIRDSRTEIDDLQQLNNNVRLEHKQLQVELEMSLSQTKQLQEELNKTAGNTHQFGNDKAELTKQLELLKNELVQQQNTNQKLTSEHSKMKSESELSLLQIQQLQEELEHYYFKHLKGDIWRPLLKEENCANQRTLGQLSRNNSERLKSTLQLISKLTP